MNCHLTKCIIRNDELLMMNASCFELTVSDALAGVSPLNIRTLHFYLHLKSFTG